jgi:hypothetical protein
MAEQTLAIVIRARDAASGVMRGVGRSVEATRTIVASAGTVMRGLGMGAVVANQGLELMKKGAELARAAYDVLIRSALEARDATDPGRAALERFASSALSLQRAVGDALVPVLVGVANVVRPIVEQVTAWVRQNRELIAVRVGEWVVTTATAVTDTLVPAIKIAAMAWYGVQIAVQGVKLAGEQMFAGMISGVVGVLKAWVQMERALGHKELAYSLAQAGLAANGLADEFGRSADQSSAKILEIERSMNDFASTTDSVGVKVKEVISKLLPQVTKAAGANIVGAAREAEAMMDSAVKLAQPFLTERRAEQAEFDRNMRESAAALAAANLKDIEKIAEAKKQAAEKQKQIDERNAALALARRQQGESAVAGALMGTVAAARAAIDAGKSAGDVAVSVLQNIATTLLETIAANLAKLAARSLVSNIPILGPLFGGLLGMAKGGFVPESAGVPGVDSVPALLMPGELVVPRDQARQIRSGAAGLAAGVGGGGGITINVDARSTVPDSRADLERRIRPVEAAARSVARTMGSR